MIQETVKDRLHAARGLGTNDVLAALGLERRRTPIDMMIPAAGLFFAGLLVGAGVAILVAPKSGRETRAELKTIARDVRDQVTGVVREGADTVRQLPAAMKVAGSAARTAFVEKMNDGAAV